MIFVPVPPTNHALSPRTRELADLLGRVIEEYEKGHPNVTGREVSAALSLAGRRSAKSLSTRRLGLVIGVLGATMLAGFAVFAQGQGGQGQASLPIVVTAVVAVLVLALAILMGVARKP